jgi:shikimate dehydrogenase
VLTGDLIDGEGFIRAYDRTCASQGPSPATSRALVVGTGGVGCAIAYALAERGFSEVAICDTRAEQAAALQARLQAAFPAVRITIGTPHAAGYQVVVNATPLGMHADDAVPIDLRGVSTDCIVADCGMKIEMTRLLRQAEELGCRIQKGKEMLIEQAPLYLEHFGWPGVSSDEFRALGAL